MKITIVTHDDMPTLDPDTQADYYANHIPENSNGLTVATVNTDNRLITIQIHEQENGAYFKTWENGKPTSRNTTFGQAIDHALWAIVNWNPDNPPQF